MVDLEFVEGKLDRVEIVDLLREHLQDMALHSPPESVHALDLDGLTHPDVSFWTGWLENQLAGCIALREIEANHAEIKSMRTAHEFRRKGIGEQLLKHVLKIAEDRGHQRVSLETGSARTFYPARKLYRKFGFDYCEPFAAYVSDRNSVFMTRRI